MEEKQITDYLKIRKADLLSMKDLRNTVDGGFGIADNLMKHAALFEVEKVLQHIEDCNKAVKGT